MKGVVDYFSEKGDNELINGFTKEQLWKIEYGLRYQYLGNLISNQKLTPFLKNPDLNRLKHFREEIGEIKGGIGATIDKIISKLEESKK